MPLSPEMERLKKAANSQATEEIQVLADAAAELEATAATVTAYAAFSRAAGIEPEKIVTAPEATAQAFGRELADLKAAQSALPKPPAADVLHERTVRVLENIDRLKEAGYAKAFIDGLKRLAGTPQAPNAVAMSRDPGADDCLVMEFVKLARESGPVPPSGQFAGGREAPRQAPDNGGQQTPEQLREEGRRQAEELQKRQLQQMGVK